jgi:hypothetical protein
LETKANVKINRTDFLDFLFPYFLAGSNILHVLGDFSRLKETKWMQKIWFWFSLYSLFG